MELSGGGSRPPPIESLGENLTEKLFDAREFVRRDRIVLGLIRIQQRRADPHQPLERVGALRVAFCQTRGQRQDSPREPRDLSRLAAFGDRDHLAERVAELRLEILRSLLAALRISRLLWLELRRLGRPAVADLVVPGRWSGPLAFCHFGFLAVPSTSPGVRTVLHEVRWRSFTTIQEDFRAERRLRKLSVVAQLGQRRRPTAWPRSHTGRGPATMVPRGRSASPASRGA